MVLIEAGVDTSSTKWGNQRKIDRCQNGVLWAIFQKTIDQIHAEYSTDSGATWTSVGLIAVNSIMSSMFIDIDDNIHLVYQETQGNIPKYNRGTPNAGRTAWTWGTAIAVSNASGPGYYPDVIAHREGTGWKAHVVWGVINGRVIHRVVDITSGGVFTNGTLTTISGTNSTSTHQFPSIDFNHTGDGKSIAGATPHLYLGWSQIDSSKALKFKKATYSGGTWTWGTERSIVADRVVDETSNDTWLNTIFDGTRVLFVGRLGVVTKFFSIFERDAADTATTTHIDTSAGIQPYSGSASYDSAGNLYIFGYNTSNQFMTRWKWTRATNTVETGVTVDATTSTQHAQARRGYAGGRIDVIWTWITTSHEVRYAGLTLNEAPLAPVVVAPTDGATLDRNVGQRFDWDFSDPDAGDTQSKFDLDYRLVGAGAWTTVTTVTPNTYHDFGVNFFAAGDYEWRVRTYDALGVVGPYSATRLFTAAITPDAPTITAPTNGGTIATESFDVQWSTPDQTDYQIRRVADLAGAPDTGTVYSDTGAIASTSDRSRSVAFPVNNRWEHVQVRIKYGGLWSPWASVRVNVSYTVPPIPTLVITPQPESGRMEVVITNPAPGGGEPAFLSNDLERSADGGGTWERIATNLLEDATYLDYTASAGVVYKYRARVYGDNGTSVYSADTVASLLVLTGTWIHDPTDSANTLYRFIYNNDGGDERLTVESALTEFAGRVSPFPEFGTKEDYELTLELALEDDRGDVDALRSFVESKRLLCVRDYKGRKLFTILPTFPLDVKPWGGRAKLRAVRVDYSEEV